MPNVTIYTDGGCSPNPGPGGWGVVVLRGDGRRGKPVELKGADPATTNNRMEMTAALEALRFLKEPSEVVLYTDSIYLKSGVTEWLPRWREGGWQTRGKTEVKNRDLWEALDQELRRHRVTWRWTKGHAGNRWNERADRLATSMIRRPPVPPAAEHVAEPTAPVAVPPMVELHAGASFHAPSGRGGHAAILTCRGVTREITGSEEATSANRMHIQAVIAGLRALTRRSRVHVHTPSDYVRDGATRWLGVWRAKRYVSQAGQPVKHRDLWEEMHRLLQAHEVCWTEGDEQPELLARARELSRTALQQSAESRNPAEAPTAD